MVRKLYVDLDFGRFDARQKWLVRNHCLYKRADGNQNMGLEDDDPP